MADVFKTVLDISLAASVVALLALAARLVIGRRPSVVLPLLSALVIIRLAIPITIPSPLSVMNLFQDIKAEKPAAANTVDVNETADCGFTQPAVSAHAEIAGNTAAETGVQNPIRPEAADPVANTDVINAGGGNIAADTPAVKALSAMDIASIIWIAGMAAMAAFIAASNIRFSLSLKKNRRYDAPGFAELLERCKEELGVRTRIEAVQLSGINTAAVYGVLRPKLLVSPSFGWLSDEEKRNVLLHELSHIRRRDTLVCLLITALSAVYWFNPVLWAALALARRDMEVMCDLAVLKLTQNKRSYASTLFSLAKASNSSKPKLVSALFMGPQNALRFGVLVSTDSIKRRMKMITRYKRSRLFTAVSIILVFAIAVTGCTGAVSVNNTPEQELVTSYTLDFSSIANDAARVANIKKAAEMIDGTVFTYDGGDQESNRYQYLSKDYSGTPGLNLENVIDITAVLGTVTEEAGWKNAAWTGWGSMDTYIHEKDSKGGYFEEIAAHKSTAETKMQAGGGIEIAAMAIYRAKPRGLDCGCYFTDPDDVGSGGMGGVNYEYKSGLVLRMRVEGNSVTAAFYTPSGYSADPAADGKEGFLPALTDQVLMSRFVVDYTAFSNDAARVANIETAAALLDGTVFTHRDAGKEGTDILTDLSAKLSAAENIEWKSAPFLGWEAVQQLGTKNITVAENYKKYTIPADRDPGNASLQAGGGRELVLAAVNSAGRYAYMNETVSYSIENDISSGQFFIYNLYTEDLTIKVRTENNMIVAEIYVPEGAEYDVLRGFAPPDIEGQELVGSYMLSISSITGDEARIANIKKAAGILDGTIFPHMGVARTVPGRQINIPEALGLITEDAGWKNAVWTGWGPGGYISTNGRPTNNEMQVGGGIEIAAMAFYRAAAEAGLDRTDSYDPEGDNVDNGGVGVVNNEYESDLVLRMKVESGCVIAAFYASGTAGDAPTSANDPNGWRAKFADKFTSGEVEQTENSYKSANINVSIDKIQKDGAMYFIADIYIAEPKYFKTAFSANSDNTVPREYTDEIAKENNAVLAINGDIFLDGTAVRNGQLYSEEKSSADVLVMNYDGSMQIYSPEEFDVEKIKATAYQVWSLGPMLLKDGKPMTEFNSTKTLKNPRTAVGYYEPGHYCFVVVDGRQPGYSDGLTLTQLSQIFSDLGCTVAYNLDGGYTSEMVFMNETVNRPGQNARRVADIIYIGE